MATQLEQASLFAGEQPTAAAAGRTFVSIKPATGRPWAEVYDAAPTDSRAHWTGEPGHADLFHLRFLPGPYRCSADRTATATRSGFGR
jgi:hypothetical protein